MVFYKLGLGFVAGITVPFLVSHNIYMTIANAFLRPHMQYRIEKEKLKKDLAVPTTMLDSYVKDVVGSFLLFFVVIGPVVYRELAGEKEAAEKQKQMQVEPQSEDDNYTRMLKQIKARGAKSEETSGKPEEQAKITFEEYEAFMRKLEKEKRLDKLELQNPRSAVY